MRMSASVQRDATGCKSRHVNNHNLSLSKWMDHDVHDHDESMRSRVGGVTMQFVRNEMLFLQGPIFDKERPLQWRCPWLEAAAQADVIVLNAGYHHQLNEEPPKLLNFGETFGKLRARMKPGALAIVRGAHAPKCDGRVLPTAGGVTGGDYSRYYSKLDPKSYLLPYNWRWLPTVNVMLRQAAKGASMRYLDVWWLSDANGQGRFDPPRDCVHQCLPGPLDEWTRLLLGLLLA